MSNLRKKININTSGTEIFTNANPGAVSDGGGSLTVDGTVTVTQGTGTNLHTVVDSGTITSITNVVHVDDNSGSLTVDGSVNVVFPQATPAKVTLSAGVDYEVKGSAGYLFALVTTLVDVYVKNNTTVVWRNDYLNACPMYLSSKIVLNSATGGDVYIVYV